MSVPVWPASLPQRPTFGEWGGTPRDDRRVFEPDVGPILTAPRTTARTMKYSGNFSGLTDDQLEVFEDFYHDTLNGGALAFRWKDPINNKLYSWKFESPYSWSNEGWNNHTVSVNLVKLPGGPIILPTWTTDSSHTIDSSGYTTDGVAP